MPPGLQDYTAGKGLFALLQGKPGCGKTAVVGALLDSVAPNGEPYRLHVIDVDRQLEIMRYKWGSGELRDADALGRCWAVQIGDPVTLDLGTGLPKPARKPMAWTKLQSLLTRFGDLGPDAQKARPYEEWNTADVLFVDGATALIRSAFWEAQGSRAGGYWSKGQKPTLMDRDPKDYGNAAAMLLGVIDMLKERDRRPWHFVMSCHVDEISLNLEKTLTPEALEEAFADKGAMEALKKKAGGLESLNTTVQTVEQYPMFCTKGQSKSILSKFNYALGVEMDELQGPMVLTRAGSSRMIVRVPGRYPNRMKGATALADIIKGHVAQAESDTAEGVKTGAL